MSMWPTEFEYERASSVEDALGKLSYDVKVLAGGHSLIPAMKLRLAQPSKLIDIGRLENLKGIRTKGNLDIGATTTHAEIAKSKDVISMCPALAVACGQVGDPQVRNFGTLGGNIAHADPASDPPTVLVACDAVINLQSSNGSRSVKASDFFIDLFTTDLLEDELVTSVEIPDLSSKKMAYIKFAHPASGYALVGVCVVLEMDGNTCKSASIGVGGATVNAMPCPSAESALTGKELNQQTIEMAVEAVKTDIADKTLGDSIYSEEYRTAMVAVYLKRAIEVAIA